MKDEVKQLLEESGYSVPESILDLQIDRVDALSDKLNDAKYSDAVIELIKIYTVCILCSTLGVRKLASRSAPTGSQSFSYDQKAIDNIRSSLSSLDFKGVMLELLPCGGGFISNIKVFRV